MVVISISLSGIELKEFDNITNKMGFSSRSDAVCEALHRFVAQNKWIDHIDNGTPLRLLFMMIRERAGNRSFLFDYVYTQESLCKNKKLYDLKKHIEYYV
jgi:metal-responsive CopG/Arc/MetJ family transcriptional regulator